MLIGRHQIVHTQGLSEGDAQSEIIRICDWARMSCRPQIICVSLAEAHTLIAHDLDHDNPTCLTFLASVGGRGSRHACAWRRRPIRVDKTARAAQALPGGAVVFSVLNPQKDGKPTRVFRFRFTRLTSPHDTQTRTALPLLTRCIRRPREARGDSTLASQTRSSRATGAGETAAACSHERRAPRAAT